MLCKIMHPCIVLKCSIHAGFIAFKGAMCGRAIMNFLPFHYSPIRSRKPACGGKRVPPHQCLSRSQRVPAEPKKGRKRQPNRRGILAPRKAHDCQSDEIAGSTTARLRVVNKCALNQGAEDRVEFPLVLVVPLCYS
mgnify:CR=1 FL=1